MLGAALASTDPVMLRGFLRRREVPAATRQALRLESGLNDAVLLPIIFIAMAFLGQHAFTGRDWGRMAINMFLLGPGAGIAVGLISVWPNHCEGKGLQKWPKGQILTSAVPTLCP